MAIERVMPQIDSNYPGFCCVGHDYLICLIFPNRPYEPVGYTTIYGVCHNPACPNFIEGDPEDPYRGVGNCDLDDFLEILEERGIKVTEADQC